MWATGTGSDPDPGTAKVDIMVSTRSLLPISLFLLIAGFACAPAPTPSNDAGGAGPAGAPAASPHDAPAAPDVLIPAPDLQGLELRNQDDELVTIGDLRGKPALLTFIYTRCPMPEMCPATTLRFKEVQQALTEEERERVRLLAVSFDPFDTPDVLAEYAELWEMDDSFWSMLTGEPDAVQRIASAYGAWFEKAEGEVYDHTMLTMVLLPDGSVNEILSGSAWDSEAVAAKLLALADPVTSRP